MGQTICEIDSAEKKADLLIFNIDSTRWKVGQMICEMDSAEWKAGLFVFNMDSTEWKVGQTNCEMDSAEKKVGKMESESSLLSHKVMILIFDINSHDEKLLIQFVILTRKMESY